PHPHLSSFPTRRSSDLGSCFLHRRRVLRVRRRSRRLHLGFVLPLPARAMPDQTVLACAMRYRRATIARACLPPCHGVRHLSSTRSEEHTSELQSPCNLV